MGPNQKVKSMSENNNRPGKSNRPRRRKRRSSQNRPRGGQKKNFDTDSSTTGPEKLSKRYMLLIDSLKEQRKKYFDEFHHNDPNRVAKLRRNFEKASKELFNFEQKLTPEQRLNILSESKLDKTYSEIHQLSELGEQVPTELEPLNPHFLKTQKESDFKQDDEESVGTMDDYRSYKGN
jgi:hypothetical protein